MGHRGKNDQGQHGTNYGEFSRWLCFQKSPTFSLVTEVAYFDF